MIKKEERILGHLLTQPNLLDKAEVSENLFSTAKLKHTLKAIKQQWKENGCIDLMVLSEKIGVENPVVFLLKLQEGVHRIPLQNFQKHINLLMKKKLMNELSKKSEKQRQFSEKGMPPDSTKMEELISQIQSLNKDSKLEVETLQDLCKRDIAKREYLITPIIGEREIIILSGFPKSGKSMLSINIAIRLAQGKDWLGFRTVKPAKTLILQQEVSIPMFKDRLLKMAAGEDNLDFLENIAHNTERGILIDTNDGFDKIAQAIESVEPKLVIVDPLITFHLKRESVAEEMEVVFRQFHKLMDMYGVTFLIIHHFAKAIEERRGGYKQRGSSVISANSDANWQWSYLPRAEFGIPEEDGLKIRELSFEFRNIESIQPVILKQNDNLWYEMTEVKKNIKLDYQDIREEIEKAGGKAYQSEIEKKFVSEICSHGTFLKAIREGENRGAFDSRQMDDQRGSPKILFTERHEEGSVSN